MLNLLRVGAALCTLVVVFGGGAADAGWSGAWPVAAGDVKSPLLQVGGRGFGHRHDRDDDDDDDRGFRHKHDRDDDDDDHHHGKHHKDKGDDGGLTSCTIQTPGGGGGCKTGLKFTCAKLKSGNKCCGCVPDKNAGGQKPSETEPKGEKGNAGGFGADLPTGCGKDVVCDSTVNQSSAASSLRRRGR